MIGRLARAVLAGIGTAYESAHPRPQHSRLPIATICDERLGHDGDHRHGRSEFWPNETSAAPPAAVDDPAGGAPASAPQPSAGSPSVPAGVSARRPDIAAPPAGRTPAGEFAAAGVRALLDEIYGDDPSALMIYGYDLGEVIVAEIARRTDAAVAAHDASIDTSLRDAGFHASNTFPQHQKHQ